MGVEEKVEIEVGIIIGWNRKTGEFMVDARDLAVQDIVFLLEHAKQRALRAVGPNREPKKLVEPATILPGPGTRQ